jgi:hypothetical protein
MLACRQNLFATKFPRSTLEFYSFYLKLKKTIGLQEKGRWKTFPHLALIGLIA